MKSIVSIIAILALAGCSPPKADKLPEAPKAMADTFHGCTWQTVTGKGLAINAYACGADSSHIHMVADDTLPGFALVSDSGQDGAMSYQPVIQVFTKAKDAPIDAILPQIRQLSPGPHTATCALVPATDPLDPDHSQRKLYQFAPIGADKIAWDKAEQTGGDGTPPCGAMGIAFAGDRIFEVMPDDPTRVSYIDYGSEIQIFDASSLRIVK